MKKSCEKISHKKPNDQTDQKIQNLQNDSNDQNDPKVQNDRKIRNVQNDRDDRKIRKDQNFQNVQNDPKIRNDRNLQTDPKIQKDPNVRKDQNFQNNSNDQNFQNDQKIRDDRKDRKIQNLQKIQNDPNDSSDQNLQNDSNDRSDQNFQNDSNDRSDQNFQKVQNDSSDPNFPKDRRVRCLYGDYVVPNYGRFDLVLTRGTGAYVWDDRGRRYLDMGAGIAVCSLGHAHPSIRQALAEQSDKLLHISNLYYHETQGNLAKRIVKLLAPGKCFFCNSGAEANEAMIKLARKVGNPSGRFEIITAQNSFHGRTMAGISASGQTKIKSGFEPLLPGFLHVPFGDLSSVKNAISPATIAVMIEGIQGEGGIHCASSEFLFGLRKLCDERDLMLLYDGVQCGHFRTGCFQSFQRILENADESFFPDAISMAKSLGGGFPIGAIWINQKHCNVLKAGTHGTTFGGSPLASAVALAVLNEVKKNGLDQNARAVGNAFVCQLKNLQREFPNAIAEVRGLGLMIGVAFCQAFSKKFSSSSPISIQMVRAIHENGMLTIPAGADVIRFLPPLNLTIEQANEAVTILKQTLKGLGA